MKIVEEKYAKEVTNIEKRQYNLVTGFWRMFALILLGYVLYILLWIVENAETLRNLAKPILG